MRSNTGAGGCPCDGHLMALWRRPFSFCLETLPRFLESLLAHPLPVDLYPHIFQGLAIISFILSFLRYPRIPRFFASFFFCFLIMKHTLCLITFPIT